MQVKITLSSFDPSYEAVATVHSMDGTHLMSCRFVFAHEPVVGLPESGEYLHKITIVPYVDGVTLPFYAQARAVAEAAKARREKRNNRVMFATPFSTDEYAEEQDLMQYLRR